MTNSRPSTVEGLRAESTALSGQTAIQLTNYALVRGVKKEERETESEESRQRREREMMEAHRKALEENMAEEFERERNELVEQRRHRTQVQLAAQYYSYHESVVFPAGLRSVSA